MSSNFLAPINGQFVDLGNVITNQTSSAITLTTNDPANQHYSMTFKRQVAIRTNDIKIGLNGYCLNGSQTYTFGPAQQTEYVGVCQTTTGSTIFFSNDGSNWYGMGSTVFDSMGTGICFNGRIWVATAYPKTAPYNSLAYSYDGKTWVGLGNTTFSNYGACVAWNGTQFVAGGSGSVNTLAYSYDGIKWIGAGKAVCAYSANGLGWNGNTWVAAGAATASSGQIAYSQNGSAWTIATSGGTVFTTAANAVAWNGTTWLAAGQGTNTLAYSQDGVAWTQVPSSTSYITSAGYTVAWSGKVWVAGGTGTNNMAYTYDPLGQTGWTALGQPSFNSATTNIKWTGSGFTAIGNTVSSGNSLAVSPNGYTWNSAVNTMSITTTGLGGMEYNNTLPHKITIPRNISLFGGIPSTDAIAYSYDGVNLTGITGKTLFTTQANDLKYNGKIWIAAGQGTNTLAYSYDAINWNGLGATIFTNSCTGINWNGTIWVAAGQGTNSLAYSYDGILWVGLGTPVANFTIGSKAVWNGNYWLAIGSATSTAGMVLYSINGINWQNTGFSLFSGNGYGLCWTGSLWIIGGAGGTNTMAYSPDGFMWVGLGNSIFGTNCQSIAWNGKIGVAVGTGSNTIAYSYDCINWIGIGNSIFSTSGLSVCWNGNQWMAGGNATNYIFYAYSYDGKNWVSINVSYITSSGGWITQPNAPKFNMGDGGIYLLFGNSNGQYLVLINNNTWSSSTGDLGYTNNSYNQKRSRYVYISSNYGQSWNNTMFSTLFSSTFILRIASISLTGQYMYIYGGGYGDPRDAPYSSYVLRNDIYISSNYGTSWSYISLPSFNTAPSYYIPNAFSFMSVSDSGQYIYIFPGKNGAGGPPIFSNDYGASWNTRTSPGLSNYNWYISVGFMNYTGQNIVIFHGNYISYSFDYGGSFTSNYIGFNVSDLCYITASDSLNYSYILYVVPVSEPSVPTLKLYVSTNYGNTISVISNFTVQQPMQYYGTGSTMCSCNRDGQIVTIMVGNFIYKSTSYGSNFFLFYTINLQGSNNGYYVYPPPPSFLALPIAISRNVDKIAVGLTNVFYSYSDTSIANIFNSCCVIANNYNVPPIPYIQHPTIAMGTGTNTIAYSDDGIVWRGLGNTIFTSAGHDVAWNGTMWVAVGAGGNTLAYSIDGLQWTGLGNTIFTTAANAVAWNGTYWIATGAGANTLAYSKNGIQWIGLGKPVFSTQGYGIAWNGTAWVAAGAGGNTLAYSTNSITWIGIGTTIFTANGYDIATNGIYWVATGSGTNTLAYTSVLNGSSGWTAISGIFSTAGNGIAWNGNTWVAAGQGTNTLAYSTTATAWQGLGTTTFSTQGLGVCWNGVRFVAAGQGTNSLAYSPDAINWYPGQNQYSTSNTTQIFTTFGNCLASNPTVGIPVAQSQMVIANPGQNQLTISAPSYYQQGFNEISIKVEQNNMY